MTCLKTLQKGNFDGNSLFFWSKERKKYSRECRTVIPNSTLSGMIEFSWLRIIWQIYNLNGANTILIHFLAVLKGRPQKKRKFSSIRVFSNVTCSLRRQVFLFRSKVLTGLLESDSLSSWPQSHFLLQNKKKWTKLNQEFIGLTKHTLFPLQKKFSFIFVAIYVSIRNSEVCHH